MQLREYQVAALSRMHNGCILNGGVGSGKSITGLAYYVSQQKGHYQDLYIITTARKRDTLEWDGELNNFLLSRKPEFNNHKNTVVVDSWNNIEKYKKVENAFFIFDEQRVVGYGTWTKAFLKITRSNSWILLSATPGDTWTDYIPVFVANGFYKNKSEFLQEHAVYNRFTNFPKIDRFVGVKRLVRLRDRILVDMDFHRSTVSHHEDIWCDYDILQYKNILKTRWNSEKNAPYQNAAELCYALRKVSNTHTSRVVAFMDILEKHPMAIVFYNCDYELEILKNLGYPPGFEVAEWNGHKHQEIPKGDKWVYLVQYNAGAEGWNCIRTDTIIFWSQSYSYKMTEQARGRIDRLNTPFTDLYFYHLKTHSSIDLAIAKALRDKKNFNEGRFVNYG